MRAVGLMVHGAPEVLTVVDVPAVHAGPGEVRVRVHAAAVNPTDTMVRNGSRAEQQKVDPPPYVPGMDIAGIVDELGPGVTTGVMVPKLSLSFCTTPAFMPAGPTRPCQAVAL